MKEHAAKERVTELVDWHADPAKNVDASERPAKPFEDVVGEPRQNREREACDQPCAEQYGELKSGVFKDQDG